MSGVEVERKDTVAIIRMNSGRNLQNIDFAKELLGALEEVREDSDASSLILTSSDEKFFSEGVDVAWIGDRMTAQDNDSVKGFLYGMNEVFSTLLSFPIPVIAAVNGHAFGNGAILSCACDFRFMRSDRGFFCFPEVDLGIPFLPGMLSFVKPVFPIHFFKDLYYSGRRTTANELEKNFVIEKSCDGLDDLMDTAISFATGFQKKRGIFGEHKLRLNKCALETIKNEDPKVIEPMNLFIGD